MVPELRAKLNTAVDTGLRANMNADVLELDAKEGRFLVAVGQDNVSCQAIFYYYH